MSAPALDLTVYEHAGLYDPAAPDAAVRAELIAFLVEQGCSLEEMSSAHARGRLFALAGDRKIRPGRDTYTLGQVAAMIGAAEDDVRRAWRACGLVEQSPDTPCASDDDVDVMRTFMALLDVFGLDLTLGLARVIGSSLARVGEALSTIARTVAQDLNVAVSGNEVVTARAFSTAADLIAPSGRALDTLFRHHIESARSLFEAALPDPTQEFALGVGFFDLCDYTALSGRLDAQELAHLLTRFEELSFEMASDAGARIVKFLGDAVMFVAADPATVVNTAVALMNHPESCASGLAARGGITYGPVLPQDGDYFGPPVNLAARLVQAAEPNTLLIAPEVAERLGAGLPLHEERELSLRGIEQPVRARVLRPMELLTR